jgi:hypothetical protein
LPALSAGDYLIFVSARQHAVYNPLRKLITNIYAPDPIEIKRVSTNPKINSLYYRMDMWVHDRISAGANYKIPGFALPR